jgi:hypothetical protein
VAISKRLRYEVLRRDGFKCRYCHRDQVILTVDHVIPQTLGGSDDPSNLVASCDDCNAGKSSSLPGGPPVRDVPQFALQWSRGLAGPDAVLTEALIVTWTEAYRLAYEEDPDPEDVDALRENIAGLKRQGGFEAYFDAARWAGGTGEVDLSEAAIELMEIDNAQAATVHWESAWLSVTGQLPTSEMRLAVHRDLCALQVAGADLAAMTVAAVAAGLHGTTRLHVGMQPTWLEGIGIDPRAQLIEDAWASAWFTSSGAFPCEGDRRALRDSLASAPSKDVAFLCTDAVAAGLAHSPVLSSAWPNRADPAGGNARGGA